MSNTVTVAWRNLGRNRRRTLTTAAALGFGICLCVATYGLIDGLNAQMLHSLTRLDLGHVQVHNPDFVARRNPQATVADPAPVLAAAAALDGVRGACARAYGFALVSGRGKSAGVELVGVDPVREPAVTELDRQLGQGRYLDRDPTPWPPGRALTEAEKARDAALTEAAEARAMAEIDGLAPAEPGGKPPSEQARAGAGAAADATLSRELGRALSPPPTRPLGVIVGVSLAKVLSVAVGSRLYASTITLDGTAEAVDFEVVGIYATGTQSYDRTRIYLHLADLQRLTGLGSRVHELAVALDRTEHANATAAALAARLPGARLTIRSWSQVRPDIQQMLRINELSTDLMVLIIFIVATLGVVNTMLMSVFERTRELGVLKAIGMSATRILTLIVTETVLLVLGAALGGTLLGLGLDLYMVRHGVDLSSITGGVSLSGIGIKPVIYGVVTLRGVLMPTAILATSSVLASLYPAVRAARMQPAVGMRET